LIHANIATMNLLFDSLGPDARLPSVSAALEMLATADTAERGAVFTRPEVVAAILDLAGYMVERPLHRMRLLEPSCGEGDFLLPAIDRLLAAYQLAGGTPTQARVELAGSVRAVELHRKSFERVKQRVEERLSGAGLPPHDVQALASEWLICDDFLLSGLHGEFDLVVGNPPYVRQERIPAALLEEYRHRYRTLYDRADLYVPFYERALDLLAPKGILGFVCANRWIKNKYGGPLRAKISSGFHLRYYIDMESVDAFHAEVTAYPAITIICRTDRGTSCVSTRVGRGSLSDCRELPELVRALTDPSVESQHVEEIALGGEGDAPWLLDDLPRLKLLRRLESEWPSLEQAGCRVGIGVATGCDRVFIGDYESLPVEQQRKLPLVMARDLVDGQLHWGGRGVVNPFEADGQLASLDDYPAFASYLHAHHEAIAGRHVAGKNPNGWYRTIDRIHPELVRQPKLLIPDIKGEATVVYDEGSYYPHHNLYFVVADDWDLRALQTVLRSSVTVTFIATYCTRMAGGFLRFQAQYLRRIRLPYWRQVPDTLRTELITAATAPAGVGVDTPVFQLYGISATEGELIARIAREAQVTAKKRKGTHIDECAAAA
jgi:hypothetical protein